jgi:hypothetical protein
MLRWYDYVAALVAADFLMAGALYALTADMWYMSLIGSFAALAIWDIWNAYCQLRRNHESKR